MATIEFKSFDPDLFSRSPDITSPLCPRCGERPECVGNGCDDPRILAACGPNCNAQDIGKYACTCGYTFYSVAEEDGPDEEEND